MASTECAICTDLFERPKVLPCGHSFCEKCLTDWADKSGCETASLLQDTVGATCEGVTMSYTQDQPKKSHVECPECREKCNIPESGISGFPTNVALDRATREPSGSNLAKPKPPPCSNCEEEEAKFKCYQCVELLCGTCLEHHGRLKKNRSHRVEPLELDNSGEKYDVLFEDDYKPCDRHRKPLEFFCRDCCDLVCLAGTATEHKLHDCVTLDERLGEMREEVKEKIRRLKQARNADEDAAGAWRKARSKFKSHMDDVKENLQERAQILHDTVNALLKNHTDAMKQMDDTFDKEFDSIMATVLHRSRKSKETQDNVEKAMASATPHKLFCQAQDYKKSIDKMLAASQELQHPSWHEPKLVLPEDSVDEVTEHIFGSLDDVVCFDGQCKLVTSITRGGVLVDVDISEEGYIYLADASCGRIEILDNEYQLAKQSKIDLFKKIYALSVVPGATQGVLVSDRNGNRENVFWWDSKSDELSKFISSRPNAFDSFQGIAITGNGKLVLLAQWYVGNVEVFDTDGKHKGQLGTDKEELKYIASHPNQTMVVVNHKCQKLCCYDYAQGKKLWDAEKGALDTPMGVSMTRTGEVIVADKAKKQVLLLSKIGKVVSVLLNEDDGLKEPTGVAYNEKFQRLVVADGSSGTVLVYKFKLPKFI